MHRALYIDRVVIVQPSFYGTDNSCTLDTIRQLGARARGLLQATENLFEIVLPVKNPDIHLNRCHLHAPLLSVNESGILAALRTLCRTLRCDLFLISRVVS